MNTFKKLVITISFFMTSYNLYDPCMHCYKMAVLVTHVVKISGGDASSDTLHNRARKLKILLAQGHFLYLLVND